MPSRTSAGAGMARTLRPVSAVRENHVGCRRVESRRRWPRVDYPRSVSDELRTGLESGSTMTAIYTFDIVSTLDGYGSFEGGDWGGFWGKQGPELLDHRLALYAEEQRLVLGANTYRQFVQLLGPSPELSELDPLNARMASMPTTVVSTTLNAPLE